MQQKRIIDVTEYILECHGPMPLDRLCLLLYFVQLNHFFWQNAPFFKETFIAVQNGPICEALVVHAGKRTVMEVGFFGGISSNLEIEGQETVDRYLAANVKLTNAKLYKNVADSTPWKKALARRGEKTPKPNITHYSMQSYCSSLKHRLHFETGIVNNSLRKR